MVKILKIFTTFFILYGTVQQLLAQDCEDLQFQASTSNRVINWEAFAGIDLPFTLVYGGPTLNRSRTIPLNFGFTHLSESNAFQLIQPEQRAQLYYGTAYVNQNQPWELYRSPWGNNLEAYEQKWTNDYTNFTRGEGRINTGLMVFDIERQWRTDFDILQLKSNENIAESYRNLSNSDFLAAYKKDLRALYARSLEAFQNNGGYGENTLISSYSDAPVWNTFDNIQGATWNDWQRDPALVNYLLKNEADRVGGAFENQLSFMTPSAYYYYDYPHPFAGEYLSYLLFQIESNRAWTNKPVIPFVWMRYSFTPAFQNQFIKPWMAEATAVFPFFSGADGLWLWENPGNFQNDENFSTYEYYLKGLRRLSAFKDMFEGNYELVIETSAREYNESKTPIWRGVAKEGKLLVAAHNPYAIDENEESSLLINHGNFSRVIKLKGHEVFLCKFDLSILGVENELSVKVYPNPVSDYVNVEIPENLKNLSVTIFNSLGQELTRHKVASAGTYRMPVRSFNSNILFLYLKGDNYENTIKVVKFAHDR